MRKKVLRLFCDKLLPSSVWDCPCPKEEKGLHLLIGKALSQTVICSTYLGRYQQTYGQTDKQKWSICKKIMPFIRDICTYLEQAKPSFLIQTTAVFLLAIHIMRHNQVARLQCRFFQHFELQSVVLNVQRTRLLEMQCVLTHLIDWLLASIVNALIDPKLPLYR